MSKWTVITHPSVAEWILQQDTPTIDQITAAIDALRVDGPLLGRPLADRITGSAIHNMKELRPGSTGHSEVRILFVFDPDRRALLLVAGDKAGNWTRWYKTAIKLAEKRYAEHIKKGRTR